MHRIPYVLVGVAIVLGLAALAGLYSDNSLLVMASAICIFALMACVVVFFLWLSVSKVLQVRRMAERKHLYVPVRAEVRFVWRRGGSYSPTWYVALKYQHDGREVKVLHHTSDLQTAKSAHEVGFFDICIDPEHPRDFVADARE